VRARVRAEDEGDDRDYGEWQGSGDESAAPLHLDWQVFHCVEI
jgi:hypothetical protein